MGKARHFRVIAYDIVSDRNRRHLETLAQTVAERVQDSVYEGWLTDDEVTALLLRAQPFVQPPADSVRIYCLCTPCRKKVACLDRRGAPQLPRDVIV